MLKTLLTIAVLSTVCVQVHAQEKSPIVTRQPVTASQLARLANHKSVIERLERIKGRVSKIESAIEYRTADDGGGFDVFFYLYGRNTQGQRLVNCSFSVYLPPEADGLVNIEKALSANVDGGTYAFLDGGGSAECNGHQ